MLDSSGRALAATAPSSILLAPTPESWVNYAAEHWDALLVDHANCEKKAASTALSLMFAYPEDSALTGALSRLAREELRHFEQVQRMMQTLDVRTVRQKPGRYAAGLRAAMLTSEPVRKLDRLLVGALIEARSAERFRLLAPRLPQPLAEFYTALERSEARHFELYLALARDAEPTIGERSAHGRTGAPRSAAAASGTQRDAGLECDLRLAALAAREAELATEPDDVFRFHSGAPR